MGCGGRRPLSVGRKMAENGAGINRQKRRLPRQIAIWRHEDKQIVDLMAGIDPDRGSGADRRADGIGQVGAGVQIARAQGRAIVNADALQVWSCWRILTARPAPADQAGVPHFLYGHQSPGAAYSVGHWLREVGAILDRDPRPVIVGGTGLYLSALTEGLADIPPTPLRGARPNPTGSSPSRRGAEALLADLDPVTRAGSTG